MPRTRAHQHELDESIPEKEDLVDDEDMMDMSAEKDADAPIVEELSEDSDQEPDTIIQDAMKFAENINTDGFLDNVLLGQGRNPGERDASETLFRMAHVFA
ncbi:hypothetical protein M5689_012947 [Euphorbia peplus]|nr:hypothetical protein M5689_012947 [Euphorbia peplus]